MALPPQFLQQKNKGRFGSGSERQKTKGRYKGGSKQLCPMDGEKLVAGRCPKCGYVAKGKR